MVSAIVRFTLLSSSILLLAGCLTTGAEDDWLARIEKRLLPLSNSKERDAGVKVDTILIHFCSDVVAHPKRPYKYSRIFEGFASGGVSAHYLIDREGFITQMVELDRAAWHAGVGKVPWHPDRENRLNEFSVGIELMGMGNLPEMTRFMPEDRYRLVKPSDIGYTEAQYKSLRKLISALRRKYPSIKLDNRHIYGHDQYARGRKNDPGSLFDWASIGIEKTW